MLRYLLSDRHSQFREASLRRIRAYVDTSVFGGTQDDRFSEASQRFFERVRQGEFVILLSSETL
jgi:hypothetical protein